MKKLVLTLLSLGLFSSAFAINVQTCDLVPVSSDTPNAVAFETKHGPIIHHDAVYLTLSHTGEITIGSANGLDVVGQGELTYTDTQKITKSSFLDKKSNVELVLYPENGRVHGFFTFINSGFSYFVECY